MFYQKIGQVYCPYFKEKISFNARGFEHLGFKKFNKARGIEDQYMRFKLIELAPEILAASGTLQGISIRNSFERMRVHNRTDIVLKPVSYYEFIAVVRGYRVKIVIKQIEEGEKFFWSLIPFWETNSITKERALHNKDLLEDM